MNNDNIKQSATVAKVCEFCAVCILFQRFNGTPPPASLLRFSHDVLYWGNKMYLKSLETGLEVKE